MNKIVVFLFLLVGIPSFSQTVLLSSNWKFLVDSSETDQSSLFIKNGLPNTSLLIKIPHTWNVMEGLEDFTGSAWYEYEMQIDRIVKSAFYSIKFEAIFKSSEVYFNGILLGKQNGTSYSDFEFDISKLIKKGKNRLVVKVSNKFDDYGLPYNKSFDWANDGGIIRDVILKIEELVKVKYVHATPKIDSLSCKGFLNIKSELEFYKGTKVGYEAKFVVTKRSNGKVVFQRDDIMISDNDTVFSYDISIDSIEKWHFDNPVMYDLDVTLKKRGIPITSHKIGIGFRSIFIKDAAIYLNGEKIRLPAMEWMPGSNTKFGMAEPLESLQENLRKLKENNVVFTRFHWQQDDKVLDWCDENGILVQEEIPLWGNEMPAINGQISNSAKWQIQRLITSHYNHPSIIAWGIGNEHRGYEKETIAYVKELYSFSKRFDSSRFVNYVSNTLHLNPESDATVYGDIIMWNEYYESWYGKSYNNILPVLDTVHQLHPNKPIIISEYGLCEPRFKGGDKRRIEHFFVHQGIFNRVPWVAGTVYFSLNDYRTFIGETGEGKYKQRVHGIMDIYGVWKPSAFFIKQQYAPIRVIDVVRISPEKIKVSLYCNDGIPSYSVKKYYWQIYNTRLNNMIKSEIIPDLRPGSFYDVEISGITNDEFQIYLYRPTGVRVN